MKLWEYTTSVGEECVCPSQLEARNIACRHNLASDNMDLMMFKTDKESLIFWCSYDNHKSVKAIFNLFKDDPCPQQLEKNAQIIKSGEYIRHEHNIYVLCKDIDLGLMLKKIIIFASAADANVAYQLSDIAQNDPNPDEWPDIYPVRITDVCKPKETICYCWYVETDNNLFLQPIFEDDAEHFRSIDSNTLNWEFLHKGDKFWHHGTQYQVCEDKNEDYYISPIQKIHLRIVR